MPDFAVGTKSVPWGVANLAAEARPFDLFAGAAAELQKIWNPDLHPKWPGGTPDRRGGKFRPVHAGGTGSAADGPPARGGPGEGPGMGHNSQNEIKDPPASSEPPQPPKPPDIPEEEPESIQVRNIIVRNLARYLLTRGIALLVPGVGEAVAIIGGAIWIYEALPYINAYLQGAKTLEELQNDANDPQKGYEIHHIVEQTPAKNDGFSNSEIEAPENRVRISALKHRELSDWYSTVNPEFGGLTPRAYLRGKSWEERREVGLRALRDFGVLK